MSKPPMNDQQTQVQEKYARSLDKLQRPDEVRVFLLELHEHLLLSGITRRELGVRAGLGPQDGPPDLKAVSKRIHEQLDARDSLPKPRVVREVAQAFAEAHRQPVSKVQGYLDALHQDAWRALTAAKERQTEAAMADGRRAVTYAQLKLVREERDTALSERDTARGELGQAHAYLDVARGQLTEAQQRLTELQQHHQELLGVDLARSRNLVELQGRVVGLLDELTQLRDHVAERDRELVALRSRQDALEERNLSLRAEADQLTAANDELRHQLESDGEVRQVPGPDPADVLLTWANSASVGPGPGEELPESGPDRQAEGPLVPGLDDDVVDDVLNDLQRGRFDPVGADRRYPQLPRHTLLHICGAALSRGVLTLPGRLSAWIPRRSGLPATDIPTGPVVVTTILLIVGLFARYDGVAWSRWGPAFGALALAVAVAKLPAARRYLPGLVLLGVATAATLLAVAVTPSALTWIDLPIALGLGLAGALSARALTRTRQVELFYDELAQFRAQEVHGPSPALLHRAERPVRYENDNSEHLDAEHSQQGPSFVLTVHDGRLRATFTCGQCYTETAIDRTPSVLASRPPVVEPAALAALPDCVTVSPTRGTPTWLCHEGDHVSAGEPLAVSYWFDLCRTCNRPVGRPRFGWTYAPTDGIVARLSARSYAIGEDSSRHVALISPAPAPPTTTKSTTRPSTKAR